MAGQAFERLALARLLRFLGPTATLAPTGGAYDGGIDAIGKWSVRGLIAKDDQSCSKTVSLVVQCKRTGRAVGPAVVREFEGAVRNWQREQYAGSSGTSSVGGVLGLICVSPRFTEAAVAVANRNAVPMALVVLAYPRGSFSEILEGDELTVVQFRLNAAARLLLPNVIVGTKQVPCLSQQGMRRITKQTILLYI